MGNNDIKVKDLSTTSSLSTDNKLMLLTDEANNTVQNITVENALANIISSNANNSLSIGTDKKLYSADISGEVGDLDNLITTNKTNIVSAINEVKGTVIPASKGYLESGQTYTDETLYNNVYAYNHSTNVTGIDTIKPADYTEVGTGLTITDKGIASGFTNTGARLEANIDFTNMNTFSIEGKFYHSGVSNGGRNQFIFALFDTTLNTNRLLLYNQSGGSANVLWNYPASDSTMAGIQDWFSYTRNAWQTFKFDYDGTNIKLYINGVLRKTSNNVDKTWLQSNYTLLIGNSNLSSVYNSNYTGQIDLNALKIYVNGDLIYQPCLLIPYNESSTGSKIVDVAYRDRVIDVFEQFGSALYYTIDETNQNATLPMGEIYGFIRQADSDKIYKDLVPCYDITKAISVPLLGNYTAPADGYVCSPNMVLVLDPDNGYENFSLTIMRNTQSMTMISCTGPTAFPFCLPVLKDDVLTLAADATVTSNVYFIPREGV